MLRRDNIIDYLKEYEEAKFEIMERELKVPLDQDLIVSIIGPRRAGKTYYLLSLKNKTSEALYLNFEDSRLINISYTDIKEIIRIFIEIYGKKPKYLFLDEIQNIKNWEIIVRELYDLKKYKIFITGSTSKLLSKEIATQLRGRTLTYMLLPFSFREFLKAKGIEIDKYLSKDEEARIRNHLMEYLEYGGFPDVVKSNEKIKILKEYEDLILFRDFIERHNIKNISLARALHGFVLQNFASEISIRRIYERVSQIKASKDTVYKYISNLEDTMYFFFLKKFSFKPNVRESWPKKIYLCDTGLVKTIKFSPEYGKLMENAVFIELLRNKNKNPLIDVFYFKDISFEIDFVIKEGVEIKQLIQVCYEIYDEETKKREVKALIKGSEKLRCKNLLVITWDYEAVEEIKGKTIRFVPLWKWLSTINKHF